MGNITIRIPQQVHIEYTLKNAGLTRRILDLLNALIVRDSSPDVHSVDLDDTVTKEEPRLGDLALQLFGADAGIDLDLKQHRAHQPLELEP
ncbi:MAG: hypothetical protein D3904_16240 [Candidatus Electrothrix sp. EH2]|jgi:hypothetical protein|nr:hypothetical protein [Candidatus Electrothrix sp. EH2]